MDRVLRGTSASLEIVTYDANGDPVDSGAGNGTANVYDGAGTEISGSPMVATRTAVGTYEIVLPSTLVALDTYSVTWSLPDGSTQFSEFEVVGSFLFTQAELRAMDPVLASETDYPDATLIDARDTAEQRFTEVAHVSFTLRGSRFVLDGSGTTKLTLPAHQLQAVLSCTIGGAAVTPSDLTIYEHGTLYRESGWIAGHGNVSVHVEHGYLAVPAPIRRAGLLFARTYLLRSALEQSDRATAIFTDLGGYRLSIAGRDGPTGIPEVDAILAQFGRDRAGSFA